MASSYESTLEYIMSSDEKGYHFTIFSDIKEPATAQVKIAEVSVKGKPSVHAMQISGMSEEADPHLKEGAPDPLHRSKGERVPFGSILLPRGAATDATLVTIDAGSTAGLVVSVPRK